MTRTDYLDDPDAPKPNSIVIALSALVRDDAGRLLMIRRTDNDKHAIPGGRHELGETMTEAVIRETIEETGITVEVTGLIGIYSNPHHVMAYDDGEVRQEFSICFRARPISGEPRTSDESSEVRWVDPAQLDELDIHPSIRLRIDHGLQERTEPFYT
ncbi:NUDIX domain-containing protein [Pseudonocardia xishanensis]|uniref:NUDIX domain-containing protein n=1 Tax=Pseudonocardia xishanensis TaxID=630995 RepID=A0ABP8RNB4_9PSEU